MKPKLTPWYPANVKPVRVGVYRTDAYVMFGLECFQRWSGHYWCGYSRKVEGAEAISFLTSSCQNVRWCGLAAQGAQP